MIERGHPLEKGTKSDGTARIVLATTPNVAIRTIDSNDEVDHLLATKWAQLVVLIVDHLLATTWGRLVVLMVDSLLATTWGRLVVLMVDHLLATKWSLMPELVDRMGQEVGLVWVITTVAEVIMPSPLEAGVVDLMVVVRSARTGTEEEVVLEDEAVVICTRSMENSINAEIARLRVIV